jgi:hypothetical protein
MTNEEIGKSLGEIGATEDEIKTLTDKVDTERKNTTS